MKQISPISRFWTLTLLSLLSTALFGQQSPTVHFTGTGLRAALDVPEGTNTVRLCDLTPGNVYTVIALGAVYEQASTFSLQASSALSQTAPDAAPVAGRAHTLRFTAPSACVEVLVTAHSAQPLTTIPMYLSIKCESCPADSKWLDHFAQQAELANLSIQPAVAASTLVSGTLVSGNCYDVSNVTSSGPANARGKFSNGATSIGIEKGIVLSTGNVTFLPGPNTESDTDGNTPGFGVNTADDPNLATLSTGNQWDVVKLEFDFTPTANTVKFDYVFGSEEYCEFVGTNFNDVFGFFISGPGITGTQNLAKIPSTNTPVAINNVNYITNAQYYVNNNIFVPCLFQGAHNLNDCSLDGWTTQFTATATVIPCSTYHIKLVIADISDGMYQSAVFLRANSFDAGGTAKVEPVYPAGAPAAYENCSTSYIRFSRDSSDNTLPLPVNFTISPASTATPGVDYQPFAGPVVIPAGQNEILFPVTVFEDNTPESQENIVLLLDKPCTCSQSELTFLIQDKVPIAMALDDQSICAGTSATLAPLVAGGLPPYTYLWNTGAMTPSIDVSASGVYSAAVTDHCGTEISDSALVHVTPLQQRTEHVALCPGGSVTVAGTVFTQSGSLVDTLPGAGSACDTVLTYLVALAPLTNLSDTISFCPGDSVTIGGVAYTASGTVMDTLPGTNGACDTIITYVLQLLPQPMLSDTIIFCQGDSITIGGIVYTGSGTVVDTLPDANGGCDTIVTYHLVVLERPARSESVALCPGKSVTIGGVVYTQAGVVLDTIPGTGGGCDTIVTYTISILPQPTRAETLTLCPRATVTIGGKVYTAPATVVVTAPGAGGDCDTIVTYTLSLLPQPVRSETLALCPGASVSIGGKLYTAPNTVLDTVPGKNAACDTIVTHVLTLLPQPVRAETISFCPGESVTIGGQSYNQPGTVIITLPGKNNACDTIVTYTLKFSTPAPSTVGLACPANIVLTAGAPTAVSYNPPAATSDCVCPGTTVELSSGLPSGSVFPTGVSTICYKATDRCGNTSSCCFTVTLSETKPCDIKVIGCIRFELLSITQDKHANTTFRIRVTNNCTDELLYTAFQLPLGVTAIEPADNSIYTAPGGRKYEVRNPNFSPVYSIRFSPVGAGMASGASDIFEYTLPPRVFPTYINVLAKLVSGASFEAHMNTFYCPIGVTPTDSRPRSEGLETAGNLSVYPNPTTGTLYADLSNWAGEKVALQVFDSRGERVLQQRLTAEAASQEIRLPDQLADGLYFLDVAPENGMRQVVRFVVQH